MKTKRILSAFAAIALVCSAASCGEEIPENESGMASVSESSAEVSEEKTEAEISDEAQSEADSKIITEEESSVVEEDSSVEEIPETEEESSEESSENQAEEDPLAYIDTYQGEWFMDGGIGYNIIYIDRYSEDVIHAMLVSVSPNGEFYADTASTYEDKIVVHSSFGDNCYDYYDGCLVDMAGYRYQRRAEISIDSALESYVGIWQFSSEAGTNTLRVFPNGTWNITAADGNVTHGKLTADAEGIDFCDEFGNRMNSEDGCLVDMAGFKWEKTSSLPY